MYSSPTVCIGCLSADSNRVVAVNFLPSNLLSNAFLLILPIYASIISWILT